jgi:predicted RNA-binding protein with RPS1 domain
MNDDTFLVMITNADLKLLLAWIVIFGAVDTVREAKDVILDLVGEVEVGGIYEGTVVEIRDFGAIIELLRNKEGLLHVSEIADIEGKHPGGKSVDLAALCRIKLSSFCCKLRSSPQLYSFEGNLGLVNDYLKVGQKVEVLCTKIDLQGSIKLSRKQLLKKKQYIKASQQMEKHVDETQKYEIDNLLLGSDIDDSDGDDEYSDYDDSESEEGDGLDIKSVSITASEAELLTVPELKDKCRAAGLLVGGTKAELIQRLIEAQLVKENSMEEPDLNLFTVPELKEKCRAAGLMVGGTKVELIQRLQEHNHEIT